MVINVPSIQPFVLYIKLFIMQFLCIWAVRPVTFKKSYLNTYLEYLRNLFSIQKLMTCFPEDHHPCQVVSKLQSRSHMSFWWILIKLYNN